MKRADLSFFDKAAERRIEEIRSTKDELVIKGNKYYVSSSGNDENDGLSPNSAWKTLARVSSAKLLPGDGVLFCRGDIFRGSVKAQAGVSYGAYGEGEKPRFYGWDRSLDDPDLWREVNSEKHIWKWGERLPDPGTLVFGNDERWARKLIPSYIDGRFVCRDDAARLFDMAEEMTEDLDMYWHFEDRLTTLTYTKDTFPVPFIDHESLGELYLRCDGGNPAALFGRIEALTHRPMFVIGDNENVRIDNVCIKYVGHHAICAGGHVKGLHVTNCEIGWIGGTIQNYYGTDPNYPEGGRGTVTRFGNGIEIYGGCEDYLVQNCYIYQSYDAGVTHQITTCGRKTTMEGVRYLDNVIERCVYAIEYFLDMTEGDTESYMRDIVISGNILRLSGYGWGQQRHNFYTPAHIKGWSYVNQASDYHIVGNVFDRAAYRMLHLVALDAKSLPEMRSNTYVQTLGKCLGQYGANKEKEPPILTFAENAEACIRDSFCEVDPTVFFVEDK